MVLACGRIGAMMNVLLQKAQSCGILHMPATTQLAPIKAATVAAAGGISGTSRALREGGL